MTLAVGMFIEGERRIYGDCLYISGHLGPGRWDGEDPRGYKNPQRDNGP